MVDDEVSFDKISRINTMIPPAGESHRYKYIWSKKLRDSAIEYVKECNEDDLVIFGGLSYCNVDRMEIDNLLANLNQNVNVYVVNPDINNVFGAVISSVFGKYVHYTSSESLGGIVL
jgi:sensor histidine kinase YesM